MTPPFVGLSVWLTGFVGKVPFFDNLMRMFVSDFFAPVTLVFALAGIWFGTKNPERRERNQLAVIGAAFAIGVTCLVVWILNQYSDPWTRPFETYESLMNSAIAIFHTELVDPSFPSNSAAITFAAAMSIFLRNRKVSIPFFILAILWGFARVYAGSHYPIDILGGFLIGAIVGYICFRIIVATEPYLKYAFKFLRAIYLA